MKFYTERTIFAKTSKNLDTDLENIFVTDHQNNYVET